LIAGMPASAGTFAFTIEVVDANGCTGLRAYALVIDCPPITLNPSLLAPAVQPELPTSPCRSQMHPVVRPAGAMC
jgi:hypothetical protein